MTKRRGLSRYRTNVVWRKKNECETHIVYLPTKLFDDRLATIRFFMKDDWLEVQFL